MKRPYENLSRRMILVALLVSLIPLNGLGLALNYYFNQANNEAVKEDLLMRAKNRAGAIELFLAERTALLEVLANSGSLSVLADDKELARLLAIMNRRSWSFVDLGVIDAKGDHRAYVGTYQLKRQNYQNVAWFQQVMLKGVYLSDVFLGYRKVPHFVIAVKHDNGGQSWVLRATIDPDVFNRLVREARVGRSGDAYILNQTGLLQTPSRFGGGVMDPSSLDMQDIPPGSSVFLRTTSDGRRLLTACSWLENGKWLLVIDQDPDEALGELARARNLELIVLGLASVFIVFSVLLLVRLFIKRLERNDNERAAMDAQLAHSARLVSLGRMAAGVAHEINNPLAAISELTGVVQDVLPGEEASKLEDGELVLDYLERIQNQVERARSVTHRMLGFARRMEPRLETVNINQVIEEAYSFVEKEALFNNVKVELDLDESLPLIQSDRTQLQQVFLNLMDNSLDAVEQGGRIRVSSSVQGANLVVRVSDTGSGVAPEIAGRIFDPFFTTKEPGQGTGLGLSVCHSIMQRLGGSLTLETGQGNGAVFLVSIPNRPPEGQ